MSDYTPIEPPSSTPTGTSPLQDLNEEQEEKRQKVLVHFSNDEYKIPGEEKGELTEEEKFWLTNECMLRYLRASKWGLETAIQRLEDTLKWRRDYGLYDSITPEYVEPESLTGKQIIFGYDTNRRPVSYMLPSRQNSTDTVRQLQFSVWMLERCTDLMGPGVESLDLMINFADRAKNPSIGTARSMLNILQSHYPERLGLAMIINVPFLVNTFFKIIMPFVDPVTRNKVKFNPQIFEDGFMTRDMVMSEWWGGERDFVWDHDKYWPALLQLCETRRNEQRERWRQLGAKVGVSEWEIRASPASSLPDLITSEKPEVGDVNHALSLTV